MPKCVCDAVFTCWCSGLPLLQPAGWDRHWEAKTHRHQSITSSSWATFHQLFLNGLYLGLQSMLAWDLVLCVFYLQNSSGCLWEYFTCKEYKMLCHRCFGSETSSGLWVTSPKAAWISLESVDTVMWLKPESGFGNWWQIAITSPSWLPCRAVKQGSD